MATRTSRRQRQRPEQKDRRRGSRPFPDHQRRPAQPAARHRPRRDAEWLESLDAVVEHGGRNRARYLMLEPAAAGPRAAGRGAAACAAPTTSTRSRPRASRGSPATSTSSAGSAPTSGGTRRSWCTGRSVPGSGSAGTSRRTLVGQPVRGRLQPLLPRQGPPRRRRPDLLPGPRLPGHVRPGLPRGPAHRAPARRLPPGAVPRRRAAACRPTRTRG